MSTLLHDIECSTLFALGLSPQTVTESGPGDAVDLKDGDGPAFAVLQIGAINSGTTLTLTVEESAGDGAWTEIAAAEIDSPLVANTTACASFVRTKRYVRCGLTIDGPDPSAVLSVLIGQQRKTF
jgi:hypothetical protein